MATICRRLLRSSLYHNATVSTVYRRYVKVLGIHDTFDNPTGMDKREMLAYQVANDDPYNVKAIERRPSTREEPNLVPSISKERMIGCVCEEDATTVNFMWVFKDEPTMCQCGHWFQLTQKPQI